MATFKLNIYKGKEIEKTYTAESYDLMFGTVEEFLQVIDFDKITNEFAIAGMIAKSFNQLKPLIMDIFPGITDSELKRTKVKELVLLFLELGKSTIESMSILTKQGN